MLNYRVWKSLNNNLANNNVKTLNKVALRFAVRRLVIHGGYLNSRIAKSTIQLSAANYYTSSAPMHAETKIQYTTTCRLQAVVGHTIGSESGQSLSQVVTMRIIVSGRNNDA